MIAKAIFALWFKAQETLSTAKVCFQLVLIQLLVKTMKYLRVKMQKNSLKVLRTDDIAKQMDHRFYLN